MLILAGERRVREKKKREREIKLLKKHAHSKI